MAARHRPHLRSHPHARYAARGDDDAGKGPKVIVAASECMLNRQRRERPAAEARDRGRRSGGANAVRSGRGHLHRRSLLHPPVRAVPRSRSVRIRILCGRIRSRTSTIPASDAGCAAKSRTRRCCAPRSIGRNSCSIPPAGTGCSPRYAARSSACCNDWRTRAGRAMNTEPASPTPARRAPSGSAPAVHRHCRAGRAGRRRSRRLDHRDRRAPRLAGAADLRARASRSARERRCITSRCARRRPQERPSRSSR